MRPISPGRGGRECPVGDEHGEGDGLVPGSPEGESRRVKTSRRAGKGAGVRMKPMLNTKQMSMNLNTRRPSYHQR